MNVVRRQTLIMRSTNATDWSPPPGMCKRKCLTCSLWFAAPLTLAEPPRCPTCTAQGTRKTAHGGNLKGALSVSRHENKRKMG